eukprot:9875148-Heterocapsa_arctica.AAC.1
MKIGGVTGWGLLARVSRNSTVQAYLSGGGANLRPPSASFGVRLDVAKVEVQPPDPSRVPRRSRHT